MDIAFTLLMVFIVGQVLRIRYQRTHIALLAKHLGKLQLERHIETLTTTYARAINEENEGRLLQVLATVNQTEQAVAAQVQQLATSLQKEPAGSTVMGVLAFNLPMLPTIFSKMNRDFRSLLQIHAEGLRYVVDNEPDWDPKTRAFHLSAELYLFQHSCHWFCKSRSVADARLIVRHKVNHKKVLESVSTPTRTAYDRWLTSVQ